MYITTISLKKLTLNCYHNVKVVTWETANLTKWADGRFSQICFIFNRLITPQSTFSYKDIDWYTRPLWSCQYLIGRLITLYLIKSRHIPISLDLSTQKRQKESLKIFTTRLHLTLSLGWSNTITMCSTNN